MPIDPTAHLDSVHAQTIYQCPRTRVALDEADGRLAAGDGSVGYEMLRGIPNFLHQVIPETQETQTKLDRLIELVLERPWRDAMQEVYGDFEYVFPEGRDKWMELLSIEPGDTVLEIGPGMGQFTGLLSKMCKELYAVEVVPEQAQFAAQRCLQDGCVNVHLATGGDDCRLPYKDNSFDWVVMNLVIEWCAMRDSSSVDFAAGQRLMLAEIHRVLKPGGRAYLLTKNRFALRLLIGKSDEHCYQMRWGNALPRPLMMMGLRRKGYDRPRGLLHSHNALAGMIRDAGFVGVDSYWATPEMRYPTDCVPTKASEIRKARKRPGFVQGEFRSTRMLMPLIPAGLVKHFTPGLQMIARKRG